MSISDPCSRLAEDLGSSQSIDAPYAMDREYEFFVTTEKPHQHEGSERGRIRRTVMRNFFETKWSGPTTNTPEHTSASTVQSKTQLRSRFRLPKPGKEATGTTSKDKSEITARRQSIEKEGAKDVMRARSRVARTSSALSSASQKQNASKSSSQSASPSLSSGSEASKRKEKTRVPLKINPSTHRFDPFDVLPVPGTQKMDVLFRLYRSGSRANALAINARNTWWSFISNDAGLMHATLATWALYGTLVRGMNELHVDKLRHKSEAIKEINLKIGDAGGKMSDELIGIVSTLASFENLLGAYDAAQLHIAALKRMVNARGGLFALGHNDGLIRGILWVDFHTAAAFRTAPSFPQIRLDPDTPPLPDALLEEAAWTSPTSLLQLSIATIDCFNIFYRLHRLALAISSHWIRKVNRLTFSNLLYETEYTILSVPDYSRDFLDFDRESGDGVIDDLQERANLADGASVAEALLAAAQIFIYAALREIPTQTKIFSILLTRLRIAIDRPNISAVDVWRKARNLQTFLWVLVVASSVASDGGRSWWTRRLSEVVDELGLHSRSEVERVLRKVAWTDVFFEDALEGIWEEATVKAHTQELTEEQDEEQSSGEEGINVLEMNNQQAVTISDTRTAEMQRERRRHVPIHSKAGRWKVNGWYI